MNTALFIVMLLAMASVLGALVVGLFVMGRGREGDGHLSNRLMQWRIIFQAVAVVALLIIMLLVGK